ncbi:alpha-amylase family glycosyl hydrolase [Aquisphaera insulae]|uniref:alpha-amylase family glycosyl hydrolase n=1 Tax=Aquisphaera insulae TaxID=2712864 RepID=UPI0013ECD7D8|nr:alpha-amylase family glycosyl hydrolase [Aquisphaera insulae]
MTSPRYPSLYQINTRPWLARRSRKLGRGATLDDIPDAELDRIAGLGFDWAWFLSVWQTGPASRQVSRTRPEWRRAFEAALPGLTDDDIPGSGFAITAYEAHEALGGDEALARLRSRLHARGLKLMLDFVPNHTALDHPWVEEHPEYYIGGTEEDLARAPRNYIKVRRRDGDGVFALGRDPYFDGWPDVLQLDYGNPAVQEAMAGELLEIAGRCDGVRCDMAMLVLPEVFERTWGIPSQPFWPDAIRRVREQTQGFCFLAEVYWDYEWALQQQGFDYAYDKRLYDRLRERHARPVREHLRAEIDYQDRLARFLENHDEPRAAATFPPGVHEAAALITYLSPGLRFLQEGQLQGRRVHIPPHLGREPDEPADEQLERFYEKLLTLLRTSTLREGRWRLLECSPAWEGNWTADGFLAFAWQGPDGGRLLAVVNYADNQGQCHVHLPFEDLGGRTWRLKDRMGGPSYTRKGDELRDRGLFVDLGPYGYHVFDMKEA